VPTFDSPFADGENVYRRVEYDAPSSRKQMNSMPPNYVHSIDSTHMMLTALHCQHANVPFAAVRRPTGYCRRVTDCGLL